MRRLGVLELGVLGLAALGLGVGLGACPSRRTVASVDGGVDRPRRADLPAVRGIDILFMTSGHELMSADVARANAVRLRARLLKRVTHTEPKDIHLGVLSAIVPGTFGCPLSGYEPKGSLERRPGEDPILTAEADDATWEKRLRLHRRCGMRQYFEPMRLALDGRNPGFPRPDALLLILLMAPENDCSLKDASLLSKSNLWPPGMNNYYARCCEPPKGLLYDVESYVDALLRQHPQRTFVYVATVPRPATFFQEGHYIYTVNLTTCGPAGTCSAAPRLAAFVKAIEARNDPRLRVRMKDITAPGCNDLLSEDLVDEIVRFGDL